MASVDEIRGVLLEIDALLRAGDASLYSGATRAAAEADGTELRAYLVSNDLWGGAGSLADQALDDTPLGEMQMALGIWNARTRSWVDAFRGWRVMRREGR